MAREVGLKAVGCEGFLFALCGEVTDPYWLNADNFAYENRLVPAALKTLRHDAVVFDIGANIGLTASMTAAALPQAHITAIEPSPRARACLNRTAMAGGFADRLEVIPMCMGEEPGVVFFREAESMCASQVWDDSHGAMRTEMTTLDAVAAMVERIDFIKIDVEGWEIDVLRGGRKTIERTTPLIVAEIIPGP